MYYVCGAYNEHTVFARRTRRGILVLSNLTEKFRPAEFGTFELAEYHFNKLSTVASYDYYQLRVIDHDEFSIYEIMSI